MLFILKNTEFLCSIEKKFIGHACALTEQNISLSTHTCGTWEGSHTMYCRWRPFVVVKIWNNIP
jgi:hypothetical protein